MGLVRGLITLTLLVSFIALTIWVWRKRNQSGFDAAARMPLDEEMTPKQIPVPSPLKGEGVKSQKLLK